MNNTFSITEAIRHSIRRAWECKWTAFKLAAAGTLIFLGALFIVGLFLFLFDMLLGRSVATVVLKITAKAVDGLGRIGAPAEMTVQIKDGLFNQTFGHLIVYGVIAMMTTGMFIKSLTYFLYTKLFLLRAKQEHVSFQEVWGNWTGLWQIILFEITFVASILVVLGIAALPLMSGIAVNTIMASIVTFGILFVTLGIIYAVRLCLAPCFIIDHNMSALESIKASYRLSRGNGLRILGYLFVFGLIGCLIGAAFNAFMSITAVNPVLNVIMTIIGLVFTLAYLVALFILICGYYAGEVYIYHKLQEKPSSETSTPQ